MKIRTGFVSNSSSSSFVLIVDENRYKEILETLSPLEKDIMSYITKISDIGSTKIVVVEGYSNEDGWTLSYYKPGSGIEKVSRDTLQDVFDGLLRKLKDGKHFYSYQNY